MQETPFHPFDKSLAEILRRRYIREVSIWLLGKEEMSILAQASGSSWESAMTLLTLCEVADVYEKANEEPEIIKQIRNKSVWVAKWLLTKQNEVEGDKFTNWEGVTWDTAVIIHSLLTVLLKYKNEFSREDRENILDAARKGSMWLYYRFNQWETEIKYPFGPADVARIINTFIYLNEFFPDLFVKIQEEYKVKINPSDNGDWLTPIVSYLLHRKTRETLTVNIGESTEDVVTYWWDDYFSTAEVIDSLGKYINYCNSIPDLKNNKKETIKIIKEVLVRACAYFEHSQIDGMWGSHVDTVKILYSYVAIRKLIPQQNHLIGDDFFIPEIHTTFKALRWMCDEKQIFSDGSFLHTMFITTFYAAALVEVYKSWVPARDNIVKIYDDVVWSSPVRSTPERIKRLGLAIKNEELEHSIECANQEITTTINNLVHCQHKHKKTLLTFLSLFVSLLLCVFFGSRLDVFSIDIKTTIKDVSDVIAYLGVFLTLMVAVIAGVWKAK